MTARERSNGEAKNVARANKKDNKLQECLKRTIKKRGIHTKRKHPTTPQNPSDTASSCYLHKAAYSRKKAVIATNAKGALHRKTLRSSNIP